MLATCSLPPSLISTSHTYFYRQYCINYQTNRPKLVFMELLQLPIKADVIIVGASFIYILFINIHFHDQNSNRIYFYLSKLSIVRFKNWDNDSFSNWKEILYLTRILTHYIIPMETIRIKILVRDFFSIWIEITNSIFEMH